MNRAQFPYDYIPDKDVGRPLFNAELYFGIPNLDPEIPANQIDVYGKQEDGTSVLLPQPIETGAGGVPLYNGSPIELLVDELTYSFKALSRTGSQVYYAENVAAVLTADAIPEIFSNSILVVDTFADLANTPAAVDQVVKTKGYSSEGIGGSDYIAVSGSAAPSSRLEIDSDTAGIFWRAINYTLPYPELVGAIGDIATDDSGALEWLIDYCGSSITQEWSGTYRITQQLDLVSPKIISNNAKIYKEFDGIGLRITGGSEYFQLDGRLTVFGYGAYAATGLIASTSASAHGVEIAGVRMRINGWLEAFNHIGDGISIVSNSNMNRSNARMRAGINNGVGIRFTGTQDDCSVWQLVTHSSGNFAGSHHVADDWMGRQWEWFAYGEDSKNAAGTSGFYLGKLRNSRLFVYSEEQTLGGDEITVGANCSALNVFSGRNNRDVNNAASSCVITGGMGGLYSAGTILYEPESRCPNITDNNARYIAKRSYGSSNFLIVEDRIIGDGQIERQINPRSAGSEVTLLTNYNGQTIKLFGTTKPQIITLYSAGTRSSPTNAATGVIRQDRAYARVNAADKELNRIEHSLDALNGNRADSTITIYVCNDSLAPVASVKILKNGDVELLNVSGAFISKSPDGTRYKITPPNGGGAATWVPA